MNEVKVLFHNINKYEKFSICAIYTILIINALIFKDSPIALISAFCGISYTFWAGKGIPACYIFGLAGSVFYCILAYKSAFWGNLLLYAFYYIPMQIIGFFKWNANLNKEKNVIVKTYLTLSERVKLTLITIMLSGLTSVFLYYANDTSPFIDGITTIFSIAGMYLTVKRCLEQWIVWIIVNSLSLIMWIKIVMQGEMVISTVIMWLVYLILAIYFYVNWKNELN